MIAAAHDREIGSLRAAGLRLRAGTESGL